jgi:hypothetical protein
MSNRTYRTIRESEPSRWEDCLGRLRAGASLGTVEAALGMPRGSLTRYLERTASASKAECELVRQDVLSALSDARTIAEAAVANRKPELYLERGPGRLLGDDWADKANDTNDLAHPQPSPQMLLAALATLRAQGISLDSLVDQMGAAPGGVLDLLGVSNTLQGEGNRAGQCSPSSSPLPAPYGGRGVSGSPVYGESSLESQGNKESQRNKESQTDSPPHPVPLSQIETSKESLLRALAEHFEAPPEENLEEALKGAEVAPRAPRRVTKAQEAKNLEGLSVAHLGPFVPKPKDGREDNFKEEALEAKKKQEELAHLPESLKKFLGGSPP